MSKVIAGNIKIAEKDVERLFKEVKANHQGMGFWLKKDPLDLTDDEFVMPNGLILDKVLGRRWLTFYKANDTKA